MDKITEDLKVIIKEINKQKEVKDVEFSLNTSQSGQASFITKTLHGELDAIIVRSKQAIHVKISLDGFDNEIIFEHISLIGDNYLPIRLGALASTGENFRDSPVRWVLNNKLRFELRGPLSTNVNFVVRYR